MLIRIGEYGGDDALPIRIVESIVDRCWCDAKAGGLLPVDVYEDRKPMSVEIAGDVGKLRKFS